MSVGNLWLILFAAVLVIVAGYLIAVETALGRVSRSTIEEQARAGRKSATVLLTVLEDRPRYVNVLLFLSTLATVTATAIVTLVSLNILSGSWRWATGYAVLVAVAVMLVVSYVALGVAPRTLGRQRATTLAVRSARLARALARVLGPLATLLILIGNALTPGRGYREGPFDTQADLRELVDLAEADQLIEDDERQMIHSVFELGDTFAKEVMVPRTEMVMIERDKSLRQAMSLGLRSGFSRIPVMGEDADDIVGIIYLKDVTRRLFDRRDSSENELVESLMRPAHFVPDSKQVDELLREMQVARVHLVIVVDEYGGTSGLVTIEDILEEIVGEIADEFDTEMPEVTELDDGRFRVSSRLHVEDFGELIGMHIDSEDEGVDTVLGYMAKQLGRVPIPGAEVRVDGWALTAERAAGRRNRIGTVLLSRVESVEQVDE